jgi:hypothetical protein
MLGRPRKTGARDRGIAFEYAVHDAVISAEPVVVERVADALKKCRIVRGNPASILFAIGKTGAQQLISTDTSLITENRSGIVRTVCPQDTGIPWSSATYHRFSSLEPV